MIANNLLLNFRNKAGVESIILFSLPFIISFIYVIFFAINTPLIHDWIVIRELYVSDNLFYDFWRPTNGHRNFVAKALYYILFQTSSFNLKLLIYLNLFIVWCNILFVTYVCKNSLNLSSRQLIPVVWIAFTLSQYGNLLYAWQISLNGSILFSFSAFHFLSKQESWRNIFLAFICGFLAMASFGNGLLVFPVALFYLIVKKRNLYKIVSWGILFGLSWILYFTDYSRGGGIEENLSFSLYNVFYFLFNLLSNGGLIGLGKTGAFYSITTTFGILLFFLFVFVTFFNIKKIFSKDIALPHVLFIYFSLIIIQIALGRGNSQYGIAAAFSSQYSTFLLFLYALSFGFVSNKINEFRQLNLNKGLVRVLRASYVSLFLVIVSLGNLFGFLMGPQIYGKNLQKQYLSLNFKSYPTEFLYEILRIEEDSELIELSSLKATEKNIFYNNDISYQRWLIVNKEDAFRVRQSNSGANSTVLPLDSIYEISNAENIENLIIRTSPLRKNIDSDIKVNFYNEVGDVIHQQVFNFGEVRFKGFLMFNKQLINQALLSNNILRISIDYNSDDYFFNCRNFTNSSYVDLNLVNNHSCFPEVEININYRYMWFLRIDNLKKNARKII
jgi:hypothetical protein